MHQTQATSGVASLAETLCLYFQVQLFNQAIIFFQVGIVQILMVRSPLLLSPKGNRSAVDFYFSAEWHRKLLDVTSLTSNRTANIWYLTIQTARRHNPRRMSAFGPAHARVVGEGGLNI